MKASIGKLAIVTLLGLGVAQMAIAADKTRGSKKYEAPKMSKQEARFAKKAARSKHTAAFDGRSKKAKRSRMRVSDAQTITVSSSCTYAANFTDSFDTTKSFSSYYNYLAPNGDTYSFQFKATGTSFDPANPPSSSISIEEIGEDKITTSAAYPSADPASIKAPLSFVETKTDNDWAMNSIQNLTTVPIVAVFNAVIGLETTLTAFPRAGNEIDEAGSVFTIASTGAQVASNDGTSYDQYIASAYISATNGSSDDLYFSNELFYKSGSDYIAYALCSAQFSV